MSTDPVTENLRLRNRLMTIDKRSTGAIDAMTEHIDRITHNHRVSRERIRARNQSEIDRENQVGHT